MLNHPVPKTFLDAANELHAVWAVAILLDETLEILLVIYSFKKKL
jgi:hypothetical protein